MSRVASRLGAVAVALLAATAAAAPQEYRATLVRGDVRLHSDEGMLLLLTEGGVGISLLRLVSVDGSASIELTDLGALRQLNVMRARAGAYRLERIATVAGRVQLFKAGDPGTPVVNVTAGALSYPGDFYFAPRTAGVKVRFGANSLDELAYTFRLSRRADDELFERRPLVIDGPLVELLKAELDAPPQPEWRYADWLAHARLPPPAEQLEVVNRMLAKVGVEPLALGATREVVETRLKKLTAAEGRLFFQGKTLGFLMLAGNWGFAGEQLGANLFFEKDALSRVSLRAIDGWNVWSAPRRDTYEDIKSYAETQPAPQP